MAVIVEWCENKRIFRQDSDSLLLILTTKRTENRWMRITTDGGLFHLCQEVKRQLGGGGRGRGRERDRIG